MHLGYNASQQSLQNELSIPPHLGPVRPFHLAKRFGSTLEKSLCASTRAGCGGMRGSFLFPAMVGVR